ncbi:hypothetical protein F4083_03260 [Candidatus Poribacteria bacterium]|nr:hypothetical protein [Candidatus Poribacteria bacterium]MYF54868.1 hypothetical protein [Candidatus Poribacteria bacterium]MYI93329.1 hypothetical protein [Candidatus Poribacteria bacterium]
MRGRHYLFFYILALLFVMFDSGVYADDGTLVFDNEPTFAQLDDPEYANGMYTTPSVHTTETLIQWANQCDLNVFKLYVESKFLVMKRRAADTAAYGGLKWKSKTKKLVSTAEQALTGNYSGLFVTFVNELIDSSGKIDREQQYALACKEVNAHITKLNAATEQWSTMHSKATIVSARYKEQNTSTSSITRHLTPYEPEEYTPPSAVYPTWECKGNGLISKQCDDTFDTPYAARDTHGIKCGGEKDPNPSVGGCGRYYYTCQDNYDAKRVEHGVKYCNNYISWWPPLSLPKRVGICGAPFRDCQFSASRKGVHSYTAVESTVNGNKYISGYTVKISGYRGDDGKSYHHGSTTPPSAQDGKPVVHGANGVGVDAVIPDETPNCDSCLDGSDNCPNASSHEGNAAIPDATPNCDECTDGNDDCPNASAH